MIRLLKWFEIISEKQDLCDLKDFTVVSQISRVLLEKLFFLRKKIKMTAVHEKSLYYALKDTYEWKFSLPSIQSW